MAFSINWSKIFPYNATNVIGNTRESAGIYRLSYRNAGGGLTVFYVGQAAEIQTRLLQHLDDSEVNDCIKRIISTTECHFRFAYVPNQEDRGCTERFLYDHYNPSCNHIAPPSDPCTVNLE